HGSEVKLQPELHRAGAMGVNRAKESIADVTIRRSGTEGGSDGIDRVPRPVTTDGVAPRIAFDRIENAELSRIEYVESLGAKLKCAFSQDFKVPQQDPVEVDAARVI